MAAWAEALSVNHHSRNGFDLREIPRPVATDSCKFRHLDAANAASKTFCSHFQAGAVNSCSKVSHVNTPNACGTPVSCDDWPMPRTTSLAITS